MGRIPSLIVNNETLDEVIASYVENKRQFDGLKRITERENGQIKAMMLELDLSERQVGDHIITRTVQTRESMNEERLLELVKTKCPKEVQEKLIRTKEYVDMDCLEDALYSKDISSDFLLDLDTCRVVKEVVALRVSKVKRSKEEDE